MARRQIDDAADWWWGERRTHDCAFRGATGLFALSNAESFDQELSSASH